jgi:hypothetical protein
MIDIARLQAEAGALVSQTSTATVGEDAADQERRMREAALIGQMAQGIAPTPRNQRRAR